jgi:hypothetical protein
MKKDATTADVMDRVETARLDLKSAKARLAAATSVRASNAECWALGTVLKNGQFKVRRIVWGRLMARAEKRPGERIRRATIYIKRMSRIAKE